MQAIANLVLSLVSSTQHSDAVRSYSLKEKVKHFETKEDEEQEEDYEEDEEVCLC